MKETNHKDFAFVASIYILSMWSILQVAAVIPKLADFLPVLAVIKIISGPVAVFVAFILLRAQERKTKANLPLLGFGVYGALTASLSSPPIFEFSLQSLAWGVAFGFAIPKLFKTQKEVILLLRVLTVALVISAILAISLGSIEAESASTFSSAERVRISYGFNPSYLGMLGSSTFILSYLGILTHRDLGKKLFIVSALFGVLLVLLPDSRTNIVLIAVFFLYMISKNQPIIRTIMGLSMVLFFLLKIQTSDQEFSFSSLDRLSSGRLTVWNTIFESNFPSNQTQSIAIGNGYARWPTQYKNSTSFTVERASGFRGKMHVDNFYLDTLCSTGLVGLLLFFLGMLRLWKTSYKTRKKNNSEILLFVRASLLALSVSSITSTFFPSFGNTINSSILLVVVSLSSVLSNDPYELITSKPKRDRTK